MSQRRNHKPFRHLKRLLQNHDIRLEDLPATRIPPCGMQPLTPQQEDRLFREAMRGVRPLEGGRSIAPLPRRRPESRRLSEGERVARQLRQLVDSGIGFRVTDTPEYMAGKADLVSEELVHRLHEGAFSVQADIDLHGMRVEEARSAVDGLLHRALRQGLQTVRIIHGRGLSSPREPVLKSYVRQWLTCGIWRKWVLAFTSARMCDGGAGATYVLLRRRPARKPRHGMPDRLAASKRSSPDGRIGPRDGSGGNHRRTSPSDPLPAFRRRSN